jgi:hypothetical protein
MSHRGLYQPRIADHHIRQLYQWAKRLDMPMTRLVNLLLEQGMERLEQDGEHISEPAAAGKYRQCHKQSPENT